MHIQLSAKALLDVQILSCVLHLVCIFTSASAILYNDIGQLINFWQQFIPDML